MRPMLIAALGLLAALPAPIAAQTPAPPPAAAATPSPALSQRIAALPDIVGGSGDFDAYFAPAFRAQVPKETFDEVGRQLKAQYGAVTKVESVTAISPTSAGVQLGFERGIARLDIVIDAAPPHAVTGLRITGTQPRVESAEAIEAEFRDLPGSAAYGVYALGHSVSPVTEMAGDRLMPLGSAFKLWVLAEAARQVSAGERGWTDIIRLGERSLPSGMMQNWPEGAPVTLHTLATMMISISDNSATDTLLRTLGRDRVDAMVRRIGHSDARATLPVLTTIEAFRLKAADNAALAAQWRAAGPDGRRRMLREQAERIAATRMDPAWFAARPRALDVEWFATPRDEAAVMNWLRVKGGADALAILAINPTTTIADQFDYVGFKGGSETGVVYGNWLVKTKRGNWYAVTGGWNRADAGVDNGAFMALMNRVLARVATQ
ncbi:serine hydrolase [Sphingomonas sp.]|uniref:serine hydrolase n=1 Tax=Sphingomonas sp. TaxID=28214 RepID=UPI001ED12090|nr:serine hydrolase [Sphingomonas sp.]MBX3595658.1 serine hydrolase [Sphingomonas sp.]